jgi:hypothetical protein
MQSLATSLVLSRLDYCNSALYGLPATAVHRLKAVQNVAAGLRSDASNRVVVPRTRLSTIGDRAFPVAGAEVWNDLLPHVTSAPTLSIFRSRLKNILV